MRRPSLAACTAVLAVALVTGAPARAQDEPTVDLPPPLRIIHVDGEASLVRDGAPVEPGLNTPLIEGDRFRTTNGRAELGLPRGAVIFLDRHSSIDLRTVNRLRLLDGRLRMASPGSSEPPDIVIDAPGATLTPSSVTAFLLEASAGPRGDQVVLRVEEGVVELQGDRDTLLVRAGESASLQAGGTPTAVTGYTRAERSEFDIWVGERLRGYEPQATTAATTSYLPDELGSYRATLDQYGSWGSEPEYGNVWYPTVAEDWRPYSSGYWDRVGAYGQFWIGYDPWAWPTHHYGRWGYRNRWFWVPGAAWAPAYVSWSVGPGYIGWSPLGFGVGFSTWGGSYYYGGSYYRDYWRGWNVLPSHRFYGRRSPYGRDYVDPRRLSYGTRSSFVTQRYPPGRSGGRGSNYAVPRYGSPRGAWGGSGIGDTRADSPRGPGYSGSLGPGVSRPRGGSSGTEPYDRARPYMDRRNVPGRTPGGGSSPGTDPYERARPYMNPRTTPGSPRSGGSPSEAVRPRSGWGDVPRAVPRSEPRTDTPRYAPRPQDNGSWGAGAAQPRSRPRADVPRSPRYQGDSSWGSRAAQPRGSSGYQAPRYQPNGVSRAPSREYSAPSRSYAPRASAPRGGSSSGRSWSGGSSAPRSAPRASSGSSRSGSSGRSSSSAGRSRSPRR